ncbi:sensor histidine kinase [Parvularcula bermudensis HTCC2503]|uniref:histidine kinase n=1 Tax=Parvularcula bermudensis (strain ATCC BAA-594 / HTCC2503 / KCTC 12087) TaxID=314260 RepID=E0TBX9_PARBH|nr:HAMP domain-containing sensor histidine kinase [Parvularcula bermudensis]ADM08472.1 sensor histidine kinase [Parvularcula bermudensis HTCC2503]
MRWSGLSLAARMALVLALSLLLAQGVSLALLLESRARLADVRAQATIDRFVDAVARDEARPIGAMLRRRLRPGGLSIPVETGTPIAAAFPLEEDLTERLIRSLTAEGLPSEGASVGLAPQLPGALRRRPSEANEQLAQAETAPRHLVLSAPIPSGGFVNSVVPEPFRDQVRIRPLIVQTILIYLGLLAATLIVTRQLSRPLARLTLTARQLTVPGPPPDLPRRGPSDITDLSAAFADMHARLETVFTEKDAMLGAIGHDLRTPLTSLRLRAERIADDELREQMIASLDAMALLLTDILAVAKTGRGSGERQAIALDKLCAELAATHPALEVGGERGLIVQGFPMLLQRAMENILDNADRYGAPPIRLDIRRAGGDVLLRVEDCGEGFPAQGEEASRLIKPFERGEVSRSRVTGGAGLGLAIAEAAASAHGGALTIGRATGGGAQVTICLPAAPVSPAPEDLAPNDPPQDDRAETQTERP